MSADVDAAWARLRSGLSKAYVASDIDSAIATVRPDIEAAIRAEMRKQFDDVGYQRGFDNGYEHAAKELAALREALLGADTALSELIADGWSSLSVRRAFRAQNEVRAALAATPAEDWMTLVPDDPNDRTTEFADERAATPENDASARMTERDIAQGAAEYARLEAER